MRTNPKILVVDDDALVVECISEVLLQEGYAVDGATDSRDALGRILADPSGYDILISDNNMPHLTGSQLIQQARRGGFAGKVVMHSGSVTPDEEEEHKAIGTDAILRKPFGLQSLIPTVKICAAMMAQKGA
jgi:CheY-like chemotaxis protein